MGTSGSYQVSRRPLTTSVVDQELFVDREAEMATIKSAIDLRLNTFVCGSAGSGKTSLLRRVQRDLEDADSDVVYANVESGQTISEGLELLARALVDPEAPAPGNAIFHGDEMDVSIVEAAVSARFGDRGAVILVDGVDAEFTTVVFGRYRDRLWEMPQVRWVVASRAHAPAAPADAFFDRVVALSPLQASAADALLERRVPDLSAGIRGQLVEALGSAQPLYWVLAAQSLTLSPDPPEAVIEALMAERLATEGLPERLLALYEAVGELGPVHAGNEALLAWLGASRPSVVSGLKELEETGLVRSERDGRRVVYETLRNALVHAGGAGWTDVLLNALRHSL